MLALRIARLPDSSLIARRLCAVPRYTVAAPSYLKAHGRPTHPMHLAEHKCFGYAYLSTPGIWHYTNAAGEQASVRPAGQLRVNNGEALLPAVLAGLGIADLPEFIVGDAIAAGKVEVILKGWKQPEGAVHLVTPPGGPRPAAGRGAGGVSDAAICQGQKAEGVRIADRGGRRSTRIERGDEPPSTSGMMAVAIREKPSTRWRRCAG